MSTDFSGYLAGFACGLPFILLALVIRLRINKVRAAREKTGIEKQLPRPAEPESHRWAFLKFIGITILVAVGGSLIGILAALFSNLIYIVFLFPLGMGLLCGSVVKDAVRVAKIRKIYSLVFLSLLMAITIYGTYHYGRYISLQIRTSLEMFPGFSTATEDKNLKIAKTTVDYGLKQETGYSGLVGYMLLRANEGVSIGRFYRSSRVNLGPIFTWLYWALEFGIIFWVATNMGKKQIDKPFCELCGSWGGKEKHLGGTNTMKQSLLLELIKQRNFMELGKLVEENAELPSVEIYFQGCEVCNKSQSRLIVRRAFQNTKGTLQFAEVSQTVLSPGESAALLKQMKATGN